MNPKHPYSGLSVEETDELEVAGWSETSFESLPPPWTHPSRNGLFSPRDALALVRSSATIHLPSTVAAAVEIYAERHGVTRGVAVERLILAGLVEGTRVRR